MNWKHLLRTTALALLVLGAPAARGHDPGLGFAELSLDGGRLGAVLSFARRDVEPLLGTDDEPARLARLAGQLLAIRAAGTPLAAEAVRVEASGEDGLRWRLDYGVPPAGPLTVTVPAMPRLRLGHRLFVSLRAGGEEVAGAVLSREHDEARLRAVDAAPGGFTAYLAEGIAHIWAGYDHLLFLLTLLLPAVLLRESGAWRPVTSLRAALADVAAVVTAFSAAHSVTLTVSVLGWLTPPSGPVEAAIALTVLLAALNNLYPVVHGRRWVMALAVGLIHGFGFAGALGALGLPGDARWPALLGFNLGVEVGQLAVIAIAVPALYGLRASRLYASLVLRAGSTAVAMIATLWLVNA